MSSLPKFSPDCNLYIGKSRKRTRSCYIGCGRLSHHVMKIGVEIGYGHGGA
jgi:hypothetical protein